MTLVNASVSRTLKKESQSKSAEYLVQKMDALFNDINDITIQWKQMVWLNLLNCHLKIVSYDKPMIGNRKLYLSTVTADLYQVKK